MLEKLAGQIYQVTLAMQSNLLFSLKIVGILWLIQVVNAATKYTLNNLGIKPRSVRGLIGIFFSPWLHGNFNHLFFNSIPLLVLSDLVLIEGKKLFYSVSLAIIILNGGLLWLFGQRGIHVGASGLIMGYFGYLLAQAYFNITGTTIILAIVCIYYFGGLILSIFPGAKKNISWDGHLFGLIAGIATAYYLPLILKNLQ